MDRRLRDYLRNFSRVSSKRVRHFLACLIRARYLYCEDIYRLHQQLDSLPADQQSTEAGSEIEEKIRTKYMELGTLLQFTQRYCQRLREIEEDIDSIRSHLNTLHGFISGTFEGMYVYFKQTY